MDMDPKAITVSVCSDYGDNSEPTLDFEKSSTLAKILTEFTDDYSICGANDFAAAMSTAFLGEEMSIESIVGAGPWKMMEFTCPGKILPPFVNDVFNGLATGVLVFASTVAAPVKALVGAVMSMLGF